MRCKEMNIDEGSALCPSDLVWFGAGRSCPERYCRVGPAAAQRSGVFCRIGPIRFAPALVGFVESVRPRGGDAEGNRYFVRGLSGHVIAIESAKRQKPAGVVCKKRGKKSPGSCGGFDGGAFRCPLRVGGCRVSGLS